MKTGKLVHRKGVLVVLVTCGVQFRQGERIGIQIGESGQWLTYQILHTNSQKGVPVAPHSRCVLVLETD